MIDNRIKKQFGSWTAFCAQNGHDHKNFKRKLLANIDKIDSWLKPLGLKVKIANKKDDENKQIKTLEKLCQELREENHKLKFKLKDIDSKSPILRANICKEIEAWKKCPSWIKNRSCNRNCHLHPHVFKVK